MATMFRDSPPCLQNAVVRLQRCRIERRASPARRLGIPKAADVELQIAPDARAGNQSGCAQRPTGKRRTRCYPPREFSVTLS